MDDCTATVKRMYPHLDGELTPAESLVIDAHLQGCPPCRERFLAEREFLTLFRAQLTNPPAPASVRIRLSVREVSPADRSTDQPGS